ncbi:MAG: NusG domain II-containing protein [Bacilli bacterium]
MKKGDIIILVSLFAIILVGFFVYYLVVKTDSNTIEIVVKNEIVETTTLNNDATYKIYSSEDLEDIYVYKDDELIKTINYKHSIAISNTIQIKDKTVNMIDANCNTKDCMKMYINESHKMPIICTNGVEVRVIENNEVDVTT